jgi:cellulose synthase/poly-beta-1,6-N-acetylglucosamine synthase-like glycosyltransferase
VKTLYGWQRVVARAVAAAIVLGLILNAVATMTVLIGIATILYLATVAYRLQLFWVSLEGPRLVVVSDERARAVPNECLPIYTVLVAAYKEQEVIADAIAALESLDYPRDRLDVKLLLEEDDPATIEAARNAQLPSHVQLLLVPPSEPRTKPKALNFGLGFARGTLLTVYDAEDRPDPLQLRRAAVAFGELPAKIASLQAKLSYYNAGQNMLTKWFTIEYAGWFALLLPGLAAHGAPLPLGGTSTHIRRDVLERVGAWDSYNVTEDADLGIRLHRAGYRTYVLDSTTLEEANSDFVNWIKQRSRWYKGYLQTWLVHMRDPRRLLGDIGPRAFVSFQLFVAGPPILALINPLFWLLTILWFAGRPAFIADLFPSWLYYPGIVCLTFGNFAFLYMAIVSAHWTGRPALVAAAFLVPVYWAMMSIAAVKAAMQLVKAPFLWEKTTHGLQATRTDAGLRSVRS